MKFLNRGSTIVGYLDHKLHLNILKNIDFDNKEVIFVVGTNGKTSTTNVLNSLYGHSGYKVLSNLEGANLLSGINTSVILDLKGKNLKSDILLLEVDEKNVKLIAKEIPPKHVIITNFFRDQLDRFFEVDLVIEEIIEVIKEYNPKIYINGQDPLIASYLQDFNPNVVKFSLEENDLGDSNNVKEIRYCSKCKKKLQYTYYHYAHIGDFYCPSCGFKVGDVNYNFVLLKNHLSLKEENINIEFSKNIPLYLAINYCLILSFAIENEIMPVNELKLLGKLSIPKGRNSHVNVKGKGVYQTLAKNVVGMEQTINYLLNNYEKIDLLIVLNDNFADSKDVSWIWDVDFEKLLPIINSLTISGIRKGDMNLRFLYSGYENSNIFTNIEKSIDHILETDNPVIISNYTPLKVITNYLNSIKD